MEGGNKAAIEGEITRQGVIKTLYVIEVDFQKLDNEGIRTTTVYFRSDVMSILHADEFEKAMVEA